MMDELEGVLDWVSFSPQNGTIWLTLRTLDENREVNQPVHCNSPKSELSVNGKPATFAEVIVWLLDHLARVKVWPLMDYYGAAIRAEFTEDTKR